MQNSSDKNDTSSLIDEVVDSLEDVLEERKTKSDRRQAKDPNNPFADPDKDRRSGKDRRDEKE